MTLHPTYQDFTVIPASASGSYLLRFSRQYRSIIRDCQEQLDANQDSDDDPQSEQQSELLYKLELIWNLVEILFVERQTSNIKIYSTRLKDPTGINLISYLFPSLSVGIVLPQLLQWIALHFPQADDRVRAVLEECPEQPEQHQHYWDAIKLFLTQVRGGTTLYHTQTGQ